jgi:hypothetical protein
MAVRQRKLVYLVSLAAAGLLALVAARLLLNTPGPTKPGVTAAPDHDPRPRGDPPRSPTTSSPSTGSRAPIEGPALDIVVGDIGGGPLAGARISLEEQVLGHTDERGRLRVAAAGLPARGEVRADADGYASGSVSFVAPGAAVVRLHPQSSVAGMVVRADDGRPVAGVTVTAGSLRSTSDGAGRFSLRGLGPGLYTLEARGERWYGRSAQPLALGMGRTEHDVRLPASAAFVVHGRVTEADAAPVGAVSLELEGSAATTDPSGRFHIPGVLPGTHTLRILGRRDAPDKLARLVQVRDRDVEVNIALDPSYTLRVLVTDERNQPLAQVRVEARLARGPAIMNVHCLTDTRGRCSIPGLSSGKIEELGPVGGTRLSAQLPGAHLEPVRFVLSGMSGVEGTVTVADGRPARRRLIDLVPIDGTASFQKLTESDVAGAFSFAHLPAGRYRLSIRPAASASADDRLVVVSPEPAELEQTIETTAGRITRLNLRLDTETGSFRGVVVESGGGPAADAIVTYRPVHASEPWQPFMPGLETVVTDDTGQFSFEAVPRGESFRILAYRATGEVGSSDPVKADGRPLRIRLTPVGQLRVKLGPAGGGPFQESALVEVSSGGTIIAAQVCEPGGSSVTFEALPAAVPLEVSARVGDRRATQAVTLSAARTSELGLTVAAR